MSTVKLNYKNQTTLLAAILIFFASILFSLSVGAASSFEPQVFWLIRLPRTLTAIAVGGALSVAGTMIQATLSNALADPYTTGVASAAALGAVIGSMFRSYHLIGAGFFAFIFSLAYLALLIFWLRNSFRSSAEILLVGITSGFFFTALATLFLAIADPSNWSSTLSWLMGSLGQLSLSESAATLILLSTLSGYCWLFWKPLDLIAVNELTAQTAGVDLEFYRKRFFILTALLTAIAVAVAGIIGFVGLIIPQILKKLGFNSHYFLIPVAFLMGGSLLLFSDVVARVIIRPSEIPVGIVMAILGAPIFLLLARKQRVWS